MKKTKKILSLLLTIRMLFACTLVPSAMATDSVAEEPIDAVVALVIDEGESPEELSPRMARGCYVPIAKYGSTGRTTPNNYYEQAAMESCMYDPFGGETYCILNGTISDPRWLNWSKWQYTWRSANGVRVIIHFNYDGEY